MQTRVTREAERTREMVRARVAEWTGVALGIPIAMRIIVTDSKQGATVCTIVRVEARSSSADNCERVEVRTVLHGQERRNGQEQVRVKDVVKRW